MKRRHRAPVPLRAVVSSAVSALAVRQEAGGLVEWPLWRQLLGARLAGATQPMALRNGRLLVHASDAAALYELTMRVPAALSALRERFGSELQALDCRVGTVTWSGTGT